MYRKRERKGERDRDRDRKGERDEIMCVRGARQRGDSKQASGEKVLGPLRCFSASKIGWSMKTLHALCRGHNICV